MMGCWVHSNMPSLTLHATHHPCRTAPTLPVGRRCSSPPSLPVVQPPLPPETGSHVAQPNRLATLLGCEFPREEDSAMAGEAGGAARRRALALAAFTGACRRTGRRAAGLPTT